MTDREAGTLAMGEIPEGGNMIKKNRFTALLLVTAMVAMSLFGCGKTKTEPTIKTGNIDETVQEKDEVEEENLTATEKIIKEAETMSLDELALKAIEESNGATFYGVGNSSRGKTALPLFIEYLQSIDPTYTMEYE